MVGFLSVTEWKYVVDWLEGKMHDSPIALLACVH